MRPARRYQVSGIPLWTAAVSCLGLAALLLAVAGRAANDDDFLREAVQSDQGFKELGGLLQVITHEMELSNVFDGEELSRGRRLSGEVRDLHQKEMQAILRALERSLAETQSRTNQLRTAGEGHRRVAESLSRLATLLAPAAENVAQQALLDKIRALAANVAPLARQVDEGQALRSEQKTMAENYGDQARNLAKESTLPEVTRHLDKAGEDLTAKDPPGAKRELEAAIRAMQEKMDGKSDSLAHAKETEQELKALADELRKAKDAANEIAKLTDPNKAADKAMDALVKENDIKDRLDAANQKDAAKDVAKAMDDMQENQYDPAAQKLAEAQKAIEEQAKALENQIQRASQEQLNAFKDVQQLADQLQKLDALQDKVADIKAEQAAALGQQPPPPPGEQQPQPAQQQPPGEQQPAQPPQPAEQGQMSPADQQKLEAEMTAAAQEMNEAGQPEAGQQMAQAEQNTEKGQNSPARQNLDRAEQALAQARQQAEQSMAQAEQRLEAGQTVADAAELNQMQQQLAQMQQQMQQSPQQAKSMAPQMSQLARAMQQAALPQAAQAMQQAQQSAQQNNPAQAQQQMQQAQQQLAQAQQQAQMAAQAMNTPPSPPQQAQNSPPSPEQGPPGQEPPSQNPDNKNSPPKDHVAMKHEKNEAAGNDPLKVRYAESTWHAKLPERERQALLSARKEPYPPQMEQDVKKYYELLAE